MLSIAAIRILRYPVVALRRRLLPGVASAELRAEVPELVGKVRRSRVDVQDVPLSQPVGLERNRVSEIARVIVVIESVRSQKFVDLVKTRPSRVVLNGRSLELDERRLFQSFQPTAQDQQLGPLDVDLDEIKHGIPVAAPEKPPSFSSLTTVSTVMAISFFG